MFYDNLKEFLYNDNKEINEWYLSDFIDENIEKMESHTAYKEIESALDILYKNKKEFLVIEICYIIYALILKSNTTELPKKFDKEKLLKIRDNKEYHADEIIDRIFLYYRI